MTNESRAHVRRRQLTQAANLHPFQQEPRSPGDLCSTGTQLPYGLMFRVLGSLRHFGRTDARAGRQLMDGSRVGGQVTNESGLLVDGGLGCGSWPKQECCFKTLEDFMPSFLRLADTSSTDS